MPPTLGVAMLADNPTEAGYAVLNLGLVTPSASLGDLIEALRARA